MFYGESLNCQSLRGGEVGQRILFRASWNYIYCLLLWLKTWSVRGASHHSVFMILVLVKGMKRGGEFKIAFCYLRGLGASPQTNGGWLLYWSLILSNGGGIWELTVSRKWNDDVVQSKISSFGFVFGVHQGN